MKGLLTLSTGKLLGPTLRNNCNFRSCSDEGHVTFYVLFALPISLLMAFLAIDIAAYYKLTEDTQRLSSHIAVQAANALPNRQLAISIINNTLQQIRSSNSNISLSPNSPVIKNNTVSVSLESSYTPFLKAFSRLSLTPPSGTMKVTRSTAVTLKPADIVLIISDGGTLRPQLASNSSPQPSWDDGSGAWKAPSVFNCLSKAPAKNTAQLYPLSWGMPSVHKWMTQACFNPPFSAIKHSAITLVQYFAASSLNRVAVVFTPGGRSSGGFRVIRSIHSRGGGANLTAPGGFFAGSGPEARWYNDREPEVLTGNESCILFSDPTQRVSYALAPLAVRTISFSACPTPFEFPACGGDISPFNKVSKCFLENNLSLENAIFWHAAKLALPGFKAEPQILLSIEQALTDLTGPANTEEALRGNLGASPLREIIILSDSLPIPQGTRWNFVLNALAKARIHLIVIAFDHPWLSALNHQRLINAVQRWESLSKHNDKSAFFLRIVHTQDAKRLVSKVTPLISNLNRELVIRHF